MLCEEIVASRVWQGGEGNPKPPGWLDRQHVGGPRAPTEREEGEERERVEGDRAASSPKGEGGGGWEEGTAAHLLGQHKVPPVPEYHSRHRVGQVRGGARWCAPHPPLLHRLAPHPLPAGPPGFTTHPPVHPAPPRAAPVAGGPLCGYDRARLKKQPRVRPTCLASTRFPPYHSTTADTALGRYVAAHMLCPYPHPRARTCLASTASPRKLWQAECGNWQGEEGNPKPLGLLDSMLGARGFRPKGKRGKRGRGWVGGRG